jgi:hypothetical protein
MPIIRAITLVWLVIFFIRIATGWVEVSDVLLAWSFLYPLWVLVEWIHASLTPEVDQFIEETYGEGE